MKFLICLLLLVVTLMPERAGAQAEDWDAYVADFGGKPGSVLIDMGLAATAPDRNFPYLVITGPHARNCDKNGLPVPGEIAALEEVLDATSSFITGVTAKKLAATFSHSCQRLNYYYVKDTATVRHAIMRLYERSFKDLTYTIVIRNEPDWITWRRDLFPSPSTRLWMETDKKIARMGIPADSASKEAKITFDFYFRADTARAAFIGEAVLAGYKVEKLLKPTAATAIPFGVILSAKCYYNTSSIYPLAEKLRGYAEVHKGYYDGWTIK